MNPTAHTSLPRAALLACLLAAPDRATAKDLIAPVAPADLLEGRVPQAWIWRHDVLLDAEGAARIQDPVALRSGEFKDALGRKALAISAAAPDVVVHLLPPAGPADMWVLRGRAPTPAALRTHPVKFRHRSRVLDRLPEEFRLRPSGSVSDLAPEDPKPRWISVADLVADGESLYARSSAPVFPAAFPDEYGPALRIRRTRKGLEAVSDEVTWGWILPAPAVLKEFGAHSEIVAWTDGGKTSPAVPARLRRSWWNGRTEGRRWGVNALPGEALYTSAGEVYVYRRGERKEVRICAFPWARASREPFSDQFGEAYAFHVPHYDRDGGRWSWRTNEPWLVPEWPAFVEAGAEVDAFPQAPKR